MNNPISQDTEKKSFFQKIMNPSWKFIIAALIVSLSISAYTYVQRTDTTKTVDERLTQLKQLRDQKKWKEDQIEQLKKEIYSLDQKIIPLKCSVYSEVWAKDTWESECRDEFEQQKQEIQQSQWKQLEEEVVPDYQ